MKGGRGIQFHLMIVRSIWTNRSRMQAMLAAARVQKDLLEETGGTSRTSANTTAMTMKMMPKIVSAATVE